MTKRDRAQDTQPMIGRPQPPADRTDPIGSGDPTDPGSPPTFTSPPSTTPVPSVPGPSAEERRAANDLLDAFKRRPLRPPAPRPKQQASSDGGDFVAYSAVTRPAARRPEEAQQGALVEIARLASLPDPTPPGDGPMVAQRDLPTLVALPKRGRLRAMQLGGAVALLVALGGVLALVSTLGSRPVPVPGPASPPPPASVTAGPASAAPTLVAAPVIAPPPPAEGVVPAASAAPVLQAPPVAPRASAPLKSVTAPPPARPQKSNNTTEPWSHW